MGGNFIFIKIIRFLIICFLSSAACFLCEAKNLKIYFLDVGEGEATLIQTPEEKTIFIDTGNLIKGFKVAKFLEKKDIRSLDHLIFTHPHLDHIGGAFFILQMLEVIKVYDNGQDLTGLAQYQDIYRWYEELVRVGNNYGVLTTGDKLLVDGITLEIVWPDNSFFQTDFNVNSIVIMVKYGNFKCLLTGDLTSAGEKELVKKGYDLKADILKVGHHGKADATSLEFIKAVSPKVSVISVGKNDPKGRPSRIVLEKLQDLESKLYRTDRDGIIVVTVDSDGKYFVKGNER